MAIIAASSAILAILVLVVSASAVALYRILLSPLARFPGPKLAALTGWYETYFDCFRRGRYWVEIKEMHNKYGPIVRISPWEIHVNDPDWNEPYKMSSRVDKYHWYYKAFGSSTAAFGTADHDLHRSRRRAQQSYFMPDAVSRFEPQLNVFTSKLPSRLESIKGTGQPVNLSNAFRSLANDVVTEYCFHKSYNLLDSPDFAASFQTQFRDFPEIGIWNRHFGLILDTFQAMPRWFVAMVNPAGVAVLDFFYDIVNRTNRIVTAHKNPGIADGNPNIIHQMLDSPYLSTNDKAAGRLIQEARTFVGAGTETTGNTLSLTTYHLLANPEMAGLLKGEIQQAQKKAKRQLNIPELQSLPYLSSVVLEGLRISSSVAGRLPRINTREAIKYQTYTIPINTPVSTTQKFIHDDPSLFPSPRTFLPSRWLNLDERKRLEKYVQPFGRGSRSCIGMHLAYAELYSTLAMIFGCNFEMKLFDTEREDLEQVHDFFSAFPESRKGLRVTVE